MTNDTGAYYTISNSRGDREKGPVKMLELYTGTVIHGQFAPYQKIQMRKHAECKAHIDRYLKARIDFDQNKNAKKCWHYYMRCYIRKRS